MSFVDSRLNFGLGEESVIDTLIIVWPDRKQTIKTDIKANQFLSFSKENGTQVKGNKNKEISKQIFRDVTSKLNINYKQ